MHWRCFRQSEHARVLLIRSKGQHFFSYIRHFEVARETGSRWLSKCIVGLFGGKIAAMLKMRLPKQSHNALWQPSWPGLPRNLKVANTLAPVDSAGRLCPGITVSCPLSLKGRTGDILIAFTTLFRITFMTLFFRSKRLGLVRIFPSDTLWLEIVTNISLQIIAENIKKKCTFAVSFKTSPWKCEITL